MIEQGFAAICGILAASHWDFHSPFSSLDRPSTVFTAAVLKAQSHGPVFMLRDWERWLQCDGEKKKKGRCDITTAEMQPSSAESGRSIHPIFQASKHL